MAERFACLPSCPSLSFLSLPLHPFVLSYYTQGKQSHEPFCVSDDMLFCKRREEVGKLLAELKQQVWKRK